FVLLDIQLKGSKNGIDFARHLQTSQIPFIYLSAQADKQTLELVKTTFPHGFLVKPYKEKDILVALEIAIYAHRNNLKALLAHKPTDGVKHPHPQTPFKNIIGSGKRMRELSEMIDLVSASDTSVLILGESGTGKELIAD